MTLSGNDLIGTFWTGSCIPEPGESILDSFCSQKPAQFRKMMKFKVIAMCPSKTRYSFNMFAVEQA